MNKNDKTLEINFDGLIGPSHNYAGLSFGNLASAKNKAKASNPKEAALQGLYKMKVLAGQGVPVGVLPPHERPHVPTLKRLGFTGSDAEVVEKAGRDNPELLRNCSAASAMWTANAATVSPSSDTGDGRVHFTPANLTAMFHRSIEAPVTGRVLKSIFADTRHFAHHEPLPGGVQFGDEGAANHNRFCGAYGNEGLALFIYGKKSFAEGNFPKKFPARQSYEASATIARQHGLAEGNVMFAQQNPAAIDAGAFHNDVVAVANKNVFFYHEKAFENPQKLMADMAAKSPNIPFKFIEVGEADVPLSDAVKSYLFNSQLISQPNSDGKMILVLPTEVEATPLAHAYVNKLLADDNPINEAIYLDVRQSMQNGGGPACLRLRVVLTASERAAMGARVLLDDALIAELEAWVAKHYRDNLVESDLADPEFLNEGRAALDQLTQILKLGSVYDFQR
ncbi:MAG: N-succinylarginine dihydrolase [Sphingomonadales bacterium]|nr:N-succinylarginine dihydrolase [Sphingomonadales bacterium]